MQHDEVGSSGKGYRISGMLMSGDFACFLVQTHNLSFVTKEKLIFYKKKHNFIDSKGNTSVMLLNIFISFGNKAQKHAKIPGLWHTGDSESLAARVAVPGS